MISHKYFTIDENILTMCCVVVMIFSSKFDIFFAFLFASIFSFANMLNENYFLICSCILCVSYLSLYNLNILSSIGFSILYASLAMKATQYISSANDIFLMNVTFLLSTRILAIVSNYLLRIIFAMIIMVFIISKFNQDILNYLMNLI